MEAQLEVLAIVASDMLVEEEDDNRELLCHLDILSTASMYLYPFVSLSNDVLGV